MFENQELIKFIFEKLSIELTQFLYDELGVYFVINDGELKELQYEPQEAR